jgi:hypothetical protein
MQRFVLITGLLVSMTCLRANAQTMRLKADVPFDFQFGDVRMPAGAYDITHSGPVLTMRTEDGRKAASHITSPTSRVRGQDKGVLVFNRYGNDYFLAKVVSGDEGGSRVLPTSRHEKEMIARSAASETVSAALRRK